MNFNITPKAVGVLLIALILAGVLGALFDSEYAGLPVLLAAVAYLAKKGD